MSPAIELRIRRASVVAELQAIDAELARVESEPVPATAAGPVADPGQCFSVAEAAEYLGLGTMGLDWMYRQREIPCIKRGTRKVFERRDLDAYKAKHKRNVGAQS